ncbi:MAG: S1 RNA-binding domain-containing protein [Candidatus Obscuribacterales bacterium]|nr:S1 RNA-binding domain-containing protein [Candidatus Obscuribacterales bacterium]
MGIVKSGMVVRGIYFKPLPAGVLVRIQEVVGNVATDGTLSFLDEPINVEGRVIGKESVRQFPGNRELRDALLDAIHEPGTNLADAEPVLLVVQQVESERIELSEAEYERRAWRPQVGDIISVTVKNVAKFGVFCAISDYEDGLVHISQVERRPAPPEIGETMEVLVMEMTEEANGKLRCALSETAVRHYRK